MPAFTQVELFTDVDGRARFRDITIPMPDGSDKARLSAIIPATGLQFRESPVGFTNEFHCSPKPQWLFVLAGAMEIGLQDGTTRTFSAGQHFLSADTLPEGATFDDKVHGHRSAQVGSTPLVTLFIKV